MCVLIATSLLLRGNTPINQPAHTRDIINCSFKRKYAFEPPGGIYYIDIISQFSFKNFHRLNELGGIDDSLPQTVPSKLDVKC